MLSGAQPREECRWGRSSSVVRGARPACVFPRRVFRPVAHLARPCRVHGAWRRRSDAVPAQACEVDLPRRSSAPRQVIAECSGRDQGSVFGGIDSCTAGLAEPRSSPCAGWTGLTVPALIAKSGAAGFAWGVGTDSGRGVEVGAGDGMAAGAVAGAETGIEAVDAGLLPAAGVGAWVLTEVDGGGTAEVGVSARRGAGVRDASTDRDGLAA